MPAFLTFKSSLRTVLHTWPLLLACSSGDPTNPGNTGVTYLDIGAYADAEQQASLVGEGQ